MTERTLYADLKTRVILRKVVFTVAAHWARESSTRNL